MFYKGARTRMNSFHITSKLLDGFYAFSVPSVGGIVCLSIERHDILYVFFHQFLNLLFQFIRVSIRVRLVIFNLSYANCYLFRRT